MTCKDEILSALPNLDMDGWHDRVYTEPNDLVAMGFPAEFILQLVRGHESSPGRVYVFKGKIVGELVGIAHTSLIWAIAEEIGADMSVAGEFTGEGYRTNAIVGEIQRVMAEGGVKANTDAP